MEVIVELPMVNTGTSESEIGWGFGGEKKTGGGRESGSGCLENLYEKTNQPSNYTTNCFSARQLNLFIV